MRKYLLFFTIFLLASPSYAHDEQEKELCPDSNTTIEIAECVAGHFDSAEEQRIEKENAELEHAKILEKDFKDMNSVQYQGFASQVQNSRDTFEAYREEECMRIRLSYGAGTMAGIGYISCKLNLTEQRIELLRNE